MNFKSLLVFPPVRRDITVIAPQNLQASEVLAAIKKLAPAILTDARMVDLFQPADLKERNLTFRLTFRDASRTLQDSEVDKARDKIATGLVKELPVKI